MYSLLQGTDTAKIVSKRPVCSGTGGKVADASSRPYQCSLATATIRPQIRFSLPIAWFSSRKTSIENPNEC
jgi:hypothetical protein